MSESGSVKPGSETSEFRIARFVMFAGIGLDVAAALLEGLKHAGLEFGWLPPVLAVVGTLTTLIVALGYQRSRTMVKVAAMAPKVGAEVAHVLPLLHELKGAVEELKARRPTLPSGPPSNLSLP